MSTRKTQKTDFMGDQVESGRYNLASEMRQAGLQLLGEHETKIKILRNALIEGEQSGPATLFDFDAFIASKTSS